MLDISVLLDAEMKRNFASAQFLTVALLPHVSPCCQQEEVIPTARELGIGIVTWAPMGAGFLTGAFTSRADFKEGDIRAQHHTKMSEENFDKVLSAENAPKRGYTTACCWRVHLHPARSAPDIRQSTPPSRWMCRLFGPGLQARPESTA